MTELTHRDIWERLAAVEVRLDERFAALDKSIADLRADLNEQGAKSAAQRERIFQRVEALEKRAAVMDAVDDATAKQADRWRAGLYVALRYVLPPSAAAGAAVWIMERVQ